MKATVEPPKTRTVTLQMSMDEAVILRTMALAFCDDYTNNLSVREKYSEEAYNVMKDIGQAIIYIKVEGEDNE